MEYKINDNKIINNIIQIKSNNPMCVIAVCIITGLCFAICFNNFSIFVCELVSAIVIAILSTKVQFSIVKQFIVVKFILCVFLLLVYFGNISQYGNPYYRGGSDDVLFEDM